MNINWRIIIPIVLLLIYALELANKLMKMNMEKAIMVVVSLLLYISASPPSKTPISSCCNKVTWRLMPKRNISKPNTTARSV